MRAFKVSTTYAYSTCVVNKKIERVAKPSKPDPIELKNTLNKKRKPP